MNRNIELLAPGGDIDSIKAAILAGADAVYCGLDRFNARNRAENIRLEDLNGILRLAHRNNCQVFLTINIIIVESEISAIIGLLNKLINTSIDGIIVQDLGLFYLLSRNFKGLKIHASTQMTTHNEGQIKFLGRLGSSRVNLSRELSIREIADLTAVAHSNNILSEVFVHGSYCISFSGICYMSSVHGGASGNRGRCSQPCRDRYLTTPEGKNFPLNLKDNSAFFDLRELSDAGVDSLKIEGRIKGFDYVYTIVKSWRNQIRSFYDCNKLINDNSSLYKVFNRDFSNSFLKGDINKDMFIDYPRDFSIKQHSEANSPDASNFMLKDKIKYYEEKEEIISTVRNKIQELNIEKAPLIISVSGKSGAPLKVSVKTPETSFIVDSEINLVGGDRQTLNDELLLEKFKAFNDTEYYIKHIEMEGLEDGLYIPFKELTSLKTKILCMLSGSRDIVKPIDVPLFKSPDIIKNKPALSILISSEKDIYLCDESSAEIYFQLPSYLKGRVSHFVDLFEKNKKLIPWFPPVLLGEDYHAAAEFLKKAKPALIVTNNTGIAYEACEANIPWIAGPYLNIANSYSLLCVKENFKCSGAFISNELKKSQIKSIRCPEDFNLYYSIYHPIVLMTSRQCFFHQVTGCEKNNIDEECIKSCNRSATITNLKNTPLFIEKTEGNFNSIYNNHNFLNTDIVADMADKFSRFFIDLRDIESETKIKADKLGTIRLFEALLTGKPDASKKLEQAIQPSTKSQYKKGI